MTGGIAETRRAANRLSDRGIRAFLTKRRAGAPSPKKLSDGGGLYLILTPAGTPVWRLKYRLSGREKLYSLGSYPSVSLEAARAERDIVKSHLRVGRDPLIARSLTRAATAAASDRTFAGQTAEWLEARKDAWSEIHHTKSRQALERDVIPLLGKLPVADITPAMVARVVQRIKDRGAMDTAAKILWHVTCVFRFAQARGLCRDNPATPVRELLGKRPPQTQRAALLSFDALRELLRAAERAPISPPVRIAHRLIAFTAARIGNAITAEWPELELDGETPSWTIPRRKMKARDRAHDHRVILGPTILAELRAWRSITGGSGYLFPSPTGRAHITHESIEKVLRVTLGYEDRHTVHGWRSSFSTLARDAGFQRDVVELTLDHVHDNAVARAYDRGERLQERIRLMYWWDAQLSAPSNDASVIPFRSAGAA